MTVERMLKQLRRDANYKYMEWSSAMYKAFNARCRGDYKEANFYSNREEYLHSEFVKLITAIEVIEKRV